MTTLGAHVRVIGEGVFQEGSDVTGVAANETLIAVSAASEGEPIVLFDMTSGEFVRSFDVRGEDEGELDSCYGIRFTPDGKHILIAEGAIGVVSMFTVAGVFVRCIGGGWLMCVEDVEVATNGDVIVADSARNSISVLPANESVSTYEFFGSGGPVDPEQSAVGPFKYPAALAMHNGRLYVVESASTSFVRVFE